MSDLNVVAHGINPETGEYLTPQERKALFKKQKMGSKINPETFRSGVYTSTKTRPPEPTTRGTGGGGAIVKFDIRETLKAGSIVKSDDIKPSIQSFVDRTDKQADEEDLRPKDPEPTQKDSPFKDALKDLLKTFEKILKLKERQRSSKDKLSSLNKKKSKKAKKKKSKRKGLFGGSDLLGIGRKIKSSATNFFGDIFGTFGDILQFAALDWLSKEENKDKVTTLVKIAGELFKWIDSTVSWAVDNTLTGFSELVGPENSISTRLSGFFKLASVFFALRWLTNPLKIIKDLRRVFKIVQRFGKFVNKVLAKPIKFVQNFVQESLNKILGKTFKSGLLKGVRRFILKVGGTSLFKLLKGVGRGFTKVISRIPILGGLLDFALNVFVFKENPGRAAFKAIGAALLAVIGSAIGPVGTVLGGIGGDWAGGVLYDTFFGNGKKDEKEKEKTKTKKSRSNKQTSSGQARGAVTSGDADGIVASMGFSPKDWDIFRNTVAQIESGGRYNISGGSGDHYDGRYQLGAAAKQDGARYAGVPNPGHSAAAREKFRQSPELQELLFAGFTKANHTYLMGVPEYRDASPRRKLQILGYAHNQGMGGAENWMKTGKVGADGFGTKGTKYTDALAVEFRKAGAGPTTTPPPVIKKAKKKEPPKPPPAIMRPSQPQSTMVPRASTNLTIDKKLKRRISVTTPVIINNIQSSTVSTSVTNIPLNSTSISEKSVLGRI